MKRTATLLSGAALALSLAAAMPASAVTPPNGAIQGTWALGSVIGEDGDGVTNGTLIFDGNGGVTGILNSNDDGTVCAGMGLSGTYVVNPGKLSGTATLTISSVTTNGCADEGDGDILTLNFFLASSFKTFNYVEIDPYIAHYFVYDFYGPASGQGTHW
jgi:hypothetical protein